MSARVSKGDSGFERVIAIFAAALLIGAFLSVQALIGGTRLLFALPAYGLLAIVGAISLGLLRATRPAPDQICLWSAMLFFGYIILRASFSPVIYLARLDFLSVVAALVVYFFTSHILTSAKARMSILACLLVGALAHVFVGAIQVRSGNNFMPISFLQRFDYGRRASGFYVCPNHLAGLLEVLGIFGLSIVCWSRWPVWSKLLLGYATALCYLALILTGSRGGYLSATASWMVFGILGLRILRGAGTKLLLRIGATGLVAAAMAIIATVFLIRQTDYLSERTRTAVGDKAFRFVLWQAAVQEWKLNPLIGTGSETYLFYGRKYRAEDMQVDPVYAHSDYFQLLAEYGAVGAATFLIFFGAHWRRGWIDAGRLGPKRIVVSHRLMSNAMALNVGALSALAAYVIHSTLDFNLHIPANVLLLAFVFGIVTNPGVQRDESSERVSRRGIFWRLLLAALAIFLGTEVWKLAPGEFYAEQARTALRDYRFLSAADFALKGLNYEKQNPLIFYYLGRARVFGGDSQQDPRAKASFYKRALPASAKAHELAPFDETYVLELAFTYDALKRFAEAEWFYDEARAWDPRSTSVKEYYRVHLEQWQGVELAPKE